LLLVTVRALSGSISWSMKVLISSGHIDCLGATRSKLNVPLVSQRIQWLPALVLIMQAMKTKLKRYTLRKTSKLRSSHSSLAKLVCMTPKIAIPGSGTPVIRISQSSTPNKLPWAAQPSIRSYLKLERAPEVAHLVLACETASRCTERMAQFSKMSNHLTHLLLLSLN
jgi:hypothetical protein